MGPKMLFLIGIVLAHGVFAAVLLRQDKPHPAASVTCVKPPEPTPYFEQKRELLAMVVLTRTSGEQLSP